MGRRKDLGKEFVIVLQAVVDIGMVFCEAQRSDLRDRAKIT